MIVSTGALSMITRQLPDPEKYPGEVYRYPVSYILVDTHELVNNYIEFKRVQVHWESKAKRIMKYEYQWVFKGNVFSSPVPLIVHKDI